MVAFTLHGCFLSRGYQTQPHGLAAFPARVQLIVAKLEPEQILVPVSPQLPGLAVQCFGVSQLHKPVGVPVHAQMSELAIDRVPTQLSGLTYAPVSRNCSS